ncbi:MAG: hypothetical protein JWQ97_977 [Phenylobacterium sp.]|nr:hypothetical protein [Phenylobacterium sp.]
MKSEFATWRDEIMRPKLTIAQRMAPWFEWSAPTREPDAPDPDMFTWWSVAELMERAR